MTTTEFLEREIRRAEISLSHAQRKPNTPEEELRGLRDKIACLEEALTAVQRRCLAEKPMTLEQLREMDGEPVYIISEFYHISEWNIPNGIGEIVIAYDVPCAGMKEVIPSIKFIDGKELAVEKCGSSWVAYRRPPEGEANA